MRTRTGWDRHSVSHNFVNGELLQSIDIILELLYNAATTRETSISKRKLYDMGGGWGGSSGKYNGVNDVFLLIANVFTVILSKYISLWKTIH